MTSSQRFQLRDFVTQIAPPWLKERGSNGEAYLYCMGLAKDILLEKMNQVSKAHMPGLGPATAIPLQADDRLLEQGPNETDEEFTVRLSSAWDEWLLAGTRDSELRQLQAYLQDTQPAANQTWPGLAVVGVNGDYAQWDILTLGGEKSKYVVTPSNWNWDGVSKRWRTWLILYVHPAATGLTGLAASVSSVGSSGATGVISGFATLAGLSGLTQSHVGGWITLSGSGNAGNNGVFQIDSVISDTSCIIANPNAASPSTNISWSIVTYPWIAPGPPMGSVRDVDTMGLVADPVVFDTLRRLLRRWKNSSDYVVNIMVCFGGGNGTGGNEFSPLSDVGAGNPDGTYGSDGRLLDGVWVPRKSFDSRTAFVDGTAFSVQCFEKNMT